MNWDFGNRDRDSEEPFILRIMSSNEFVGKWEKGFPVSTGMTTERTDRG